MERYFLDTTVARGLLLGTHSYRERLSARIHGDRYVSPYVAMEMRRGYICHLIDFYSLGEAITLWTNRFSAREVKAVLALVAQLLEGHKLDPSGLHDKKVAQVAIRAYIRAIEAKFRNRFKNTGIDRTRCGRARVPLRSFDDGSLRSFRQRFGDTASRRRECTIDVFLSTTYASEVDGYVANAEMSVEGGGRQSGGFTKIVAALARLKKERSPRECTCASCAKIGDAVIALDTPRDMVLAHTDHSFDYLCPPIAQPHVKQPPESSTSAPE